MTSRFSIPSLTWKTWKEIAVAVVGLSLGVGFQMRKTSRQQEKFAQGAAEEAKLEAKWRGQARSLRQIIESQIESVRRSEEASGRAARPFGEAPTFANKFTGPDKASIEELRKHERFATEYAESHARSRRDYERRAGRQVEIPAPTAPAGLPRW